MRVSPLNVANAVTMGRILVVPLLVVLIWDLTARGSVPVAALFGTLALSDVLDGHLARSRDLVTTLGKLLDPVADKLLVGGALVGLLAAGRLSAVVVAVIVGREVLVSVLRAVAYRRGVVIAASPFGKAKMALQVAMVAGLVATADPGAGWVQALVAVTVAVTVASGVDYALRFRHALARRSAAPAPAAPPA